MRFTVRMSDYNIDWIRFYYYQRKQYKKSRYRKAQQRMENRSDKRVYGMNRGEEK